VGTPLFITNHAFFPRLDDPYDTAFRFGGNIDLSVIHSDYNAFYQPANRPVVRWYDRPGGGSEYLTLAEWQSLGFDLHSACFDPADPEVAANIALYQARLAFAVPPLILAPCCARFLFCLGDLPGDPCPDPSLAQFSQHMASGGPEGWSDEVTYDEMVMRTFCGDCDRNGLLANPLVAYP
jgi:hypothetical protein